MLLCGRHIIIKCIFDPLQFGVYVDQCSCMSQHNKREVNKSWTFPGSMFFPVLHFLSGIKDHRQPQCVDLRLVVSVHRTAVMVDVKLHVVVCTI